MGLNLRSILQPAPVTLSQLRGETVAIDAYGLFYQFLTTLRDVRGDVLTDDHGNAISHLIGLVSKTEELLAADVLPVFVFDGTPHPLKMLTLERRAALKKAAGRELEAARAAGDHAAIRKHAAGTTTVTRDMVASAVELLAASGIPFVLAPQDAEAQCAALAAAGKVDAAASQDYDTLVYGAPRVLRNLTSSRRDTEEVLLAALRMETGLDRAGLVDVALLVGNDFHDGIPGVGPKGAVQVVGTHGSLEAFFSKCDKGYVPAKAVEKKVLGARRVLSSEEVEEVRRLFLAPAVHADVAVAIGRPDAARVHERMHEVHGFSKARTDRFAVSILEVQERRRDRRQMRLA